MIRLSGFNARAQQDVAQAVKALTQQGAAEFILDVRDNRGGLYQEGAEVAKLFLEGKNSVLAHDETGNHSSYHVMHQYSQMTSRLPLCVFISIAFDFLTFKTIIDCSDCLSAALCGTDGATVVVTEGRGHIRNKPILAKGPALTRAPLTVLVNQQSASASEIFAGALHDNCRAILVGKR